MVTGRYSVVGFLVLSTVVAITVNVMCLQMFETRRPCPMEILVPGNLKLVDECPDLNLMVR